MKRLYCLADAHLGEEKDSYKDFFYAIESIKLNEITHFIVMGDLFKFFIGIQKWITKEQLDVLEKIYKIKENGAITVYLEGNRDFFLDEKFLKRYFSFIGKEFSLEINGKKILFLHGDKINKKDYKYLIWNKISKSFFLEFITKVFPKKILLPFYVLLEKKLKNTNFNYREKIPLDEIKNFSNSLKENYNLIVMGHFHKSFNLKLENKEIILLPAFKDTKEIWSFEYGN